MRVTRHKRQILVFSGGDSCAGGGPDRVGRADFVSGPGTGRQAGDRSARRGCGPIGTRTNRAARESQITRGQAADERPLFRGSRHRERPEGHLHRKAVGRPLDLSLGRRAGHHGIEPIRGLSPGWRDGRTGEGFAERITRRRAAEELDARRDHFRGRYGHQSGQRRDGETTVTSHGSSPCGTHTGAENPQSVIFMSRTLPGRTPIARAQSVLNLIVQAGRERVMRARGFSLAIFVCIHLAAAELPPAGPVLHVLTVDSANEPVPGVSVQLRLPEGRPPITQSTDAQGQAVFNDLRPGLYAVLATKENFQPVRQTDLTVELDSALSLELTMIPVVTHSDSVDVSATVSNVDQGASSSATTLTAKTTNELPNRPATVADALPLVPGVVRDPGGSLSISASAEHRSAMVVNSTDVTDPATGQFGLTVPIDSVETINVYQTPFLAEYGRFTSGLISVETRRGGEKWKWELNDPLPEFFIRSWQLRGLKDATPRFNFEGPVIAGKLYISEGVDYEIRKTTIFELPFPFNEKKQDGVNSFAQLDWVISDKHLLTLTAHVAPERMEFVNLDYFNPQPTTPDARTQNYTGVLADHLTIFGGLLDTNFSVTKFNANIWGAGPADLVIAPGGNSGNYNATQNREALRIGGTTSFSFAPLHFLGAHNFKIGADVAGSNEEGLVNKRPVDLVDASGLLLQRTTFTPGLPFEISDVGTSFFVQDHWVLNSRLSLDAGLRAESQEITDSFRMAPRVGVSWNIFKKAGTLLDGGYGWFYDRVPLNIYAFASYPWEFITQYAPDGSISGGPYLFKNTLGEVFRHHQLIFTGPEPGNFSPESQIWTARVEQPIASFLKLRLGYTQNDAQGLVTVQPEGPDLTTDTGGYLLTGTGASKYRQVEATARVRLPGEGRQVFFSYVYSRARGDLNDFNNYLGSFPVPIIRQDLFGNLPTSIPNRLLTWGVVQLPAKFRIAPVMEYRDGFPYSSINALQEYVGVPNEARFPNFFSIDARISKDIQLNPKYGIRLSLASFNLTNHFNPETVHNNIDDPAYGYFFGHRGRRFTVDFDFLF